MFKNLGDLNNNYVIYITGTSFQYFTTRCNQKQIGQYFIKQVENHLKIILVYVKPVKETTATPTILFSQKKKYHVIQIES